MMPPKWVSLEARKSAWRNGTLASLVLHLLILVGVMLILRTGKTQAVEKPTIMLATLINPSPTPATTPAVTTSRPTRPPVTARPTVAVSQPAPQPVPVTALPPELPTPAPTPVPSVSPSVTPSPLPPSPPTASPTGQVQSPKSSQTSATPAPATLEALTPKARTTTGVQLPSSDAAYLANPRPTYPLMSKRLGEQGLVMLRVWVSAEGLPKQGQIKKSSGYERLDQAALQALAKWRFAPGKRNGQPEGMWYEVPLNFVLENRVMSENFGVTHLWAQADWVARAVVLLLLLMSLASWSVILTKAWSIVRHKRQARATEKFWHSQDIQAGLAQLGAQADDPFRALAMTGVEAKAHHRAAHAQLHDSMDVSDWVERCLRNAIDDSTTRLQAGLAILASVGATAPFVGLFGTVWGIYQALMTMGIAGQASLDKIAGPIGETLVMTALGLAVAIPAVLGYNALTRGNRFVLTKLNRFANDLHAYFVTGSRLQYEGHANRDRQAGSR